MSGIKRQYEEEGYLVTEYNSGGISKVWIATNEDIPIIHRATIEEQILAENQYQTALLEMQMLGGM